jgi:DNA topoisomerase-2
MNDKDTKQMIPGYQNYQGTIAPTNSSGYEVKGVYHVEDENTLVITELPIGEWTSNYKEFLDGLIINEEKTKNGKKKTTGFIEKFTDDNTDKVVKFTLHFPENKLGKYIKADTLEKKLKLNKKINITNMHLFNANGTIKKYSNGQQIIKDFYDKRLECYELRKAYIMRRLQNELLHLKYKVKFIEFKFSGKIIIDNKTRQSIIDKLVELEFPELSKDVDDIKGKSYSYITTMSLFALTKEKIDELNEEYDSKKAELESLESQTIKEIWEKELDEFLHEYKRWYKSKHDEYLEEISSTHKISTKKSKKSKGSKKKKPSKKKSKSKNLIV